MGHDFPLVKSAYSKISYSELKLGNYYWPPAFPLLLTSDILPVSLRIDSNQSLIVWFFHYTNQPNSIFHPYVLHPLPLYRKSSLYPCSHPSTCSLNPLTTWNSPEVFPFVLSIIILIVLFLATYTCYNNSSWCSKTCLFLPLILASYNLISLIAEHGGSLSILTVLTSYTIIFFT